MNCGAVAAASVLTLPMEYVKVNCYIAGENRWHPTIRHNTQLYNALSDHGMSRLYTCLDGVIARSLIFAGTRGILYSYLYGNAARKDRHNSVSIWKKMWLSSIAGGVASLTSAPFDLAAVRM